MTIVILKEFSENRPRGLIIFILFLLGCIAHPFCYPFGMIILLGRFLFSQNSQFKIQCIIIAFFISLYSIIISRDLALFNLSEHGGIFGFLIGFPGWGQINCLFEQNWNIFKMLYNSPFLIYKYYFYVIQGIFCISFLGSPLFFLLSKNNAFKFISFITFCFSIVFFCSQENSLLSFFPLRVLDAGTYLFFSTGIIYLSKILLNIRKVVVIPPIIYKYKKLFVASLLSFLFLVQLQIQVELFKQGRYLRSQVEKTKNYLLTNYKNSNLEYCINPVIHLYVRVIPMFLFSDFDLVKNNIFLKSEWHYHGQHNSKVSIYPKFKTFIFGEDQYGVYIVKNGNRLE